MNKIKNIKYLTIAYLIWLFLAWTLPFFFSPVGSFIRILIDLIFLCTAFYSFGRISSEARVIEIVHRLYVERKHVANSDANEAAKIINGIFEENLNSTTFKTNNEVARDYAITLAKHNGFYEAIVKMCDEIEK